MHQYIGSRYVPKFMGTYDATQIYEALCVVDNGLGTSYISMVPTPAGTPLTDTDYWAVYGASSGAIINLQNQIDTINNTDIPSIQSDIDLLTNKRVIILSDSYGERLDGGGTSLDDLIASYIGVSGTNYIEVQANGIGFTNDNGQGTFLSTLTGASISDPDTVTDIIVLGGANDYTSSIAQIETAISSFMTYVKTNYPNAVVSVGAISRSRTRANININYSRVLPAYRSCSKYGAKYLNNVEYAIHDSRLVESDNVHPTTSGVSAIAVAVAEAFKTGSCDITYEISPTYTAKTTGDWSGYTRLSGPTFYQYLSNGYAGMRSSPNGYFSLNYGGSGLAAQVDIDGFATPDDTLLVGFANNHAMRYGIPCEIKLYNGSTYLDRTMGTLYINENSELSLTFRTENITISGCNKIYGIVAGSVSVLTQET